jgi:hypothetical protein
MDWSKFDEFEEDEEEEEDEDDDDEEWTHPIGSRSKYNKKPLL